jgi:hypothetical protein
MSEIVFFGNFDVNSHAMLQTDETFRDLVAKEVETIKITHETMPLTAKQYKARIEYQGVTYTITFNP